MSAPDRRLGIPRCALGLDDDGTVRFIDMAAGSLPDGMDQSAAERRNSGWPVGSKYTASVIYDELVWWEALDLVRLIGQIAESCGYSGSWLLGAELGRMRGRRSSAWGASECGADELTATGRAAMNQILGRAREVASALLRPLFRDIGSETVLDQLENDPITTS